MKKIIYGLGASAIGTALTMLAWMALSLTFEVEESALHKITSGVNIAAWLPLIAYFVSALYQIFCYRNRFDQDSYQPLRKPVAIVAVFVSQCVIMVFLGRPGGSALGQAPFAFGCALALTLILGTLSMAAAMIWGRPIIGVTKLPFTKS